MKIILETPRLILRELSVSDTQDFYDLNSNPNVIKYTGDEAFSSITDAKDFLINYSDYERNGFGRWAVIEKNSRNFLGWCGLKFDGKETDIGFRFFEEHWGKGYATESALACLNYGFQELGLSEIIGRAMKENLASIKVLEKIGMKYSSEMEFSLHPGVLYKIHPSEMIS
jgi:ribosomal-protein-alanine N-acetyltransferase